METEILTLKTFAELASPVPEIPKEIKAYLEAPTNDQGIFFRFTKDGKSENTGDGMSYYDRTLILYQGIDSPIYDSGFLLYRPGHAFSTNRDDLRTFNYRIITEDKNMVTFGYMNGDEKIFVDQIDKSGSKKCLFVFDYRTYNKALENQTAPQDVKAFASWTYRQLPNIGGSAWHYDIYSDDEIRTVVVARHCSRSVDATHDAYRVFVWIKGEGVGISDLHYTNARDSYTKFSTNYLRVEVKVDSAGDILFEAWSQFRDFKTAKKFVIQNG